MPHRIKGKQFTIPNLLGVAPDSDEATEFANSSLAVFRLAPADYHRFHSPIDGEVGKIVHIPGQYYTGTSPSNEYLRFGGSSVVVCCVLCVGRWQSTHKR